MEKTKNLQAKIPLYKPQNVVGSEIVEPILEVLKSGWLTLGPKTEEFEKIFARFIECQYAVASNSCTSSLFLALEAAGVKKGDHVVVPVMTFAATANVVRWLGAEPIFCDVAEDGEIDIAKLESIVNLDEKVKCVLPVHLYGFPCKIEEIRKLSERQNLKLIEDCAQAHGATVGGKKVGSFGIAGCFSFYATKNITTAEGGIMVTNDKAIKDRVSLVRNHCQTKNPLEKATDYSYDIVDLGFNFRLSEIGAAIGISQMEKIESMTISRQQIAKRYKEELDKIDGITMLHDPFLMGYRQGVYHLLVVKVEDEYPLTRDELYVHLQRNRIISGVHYPPLHYFSYYKNTTNYKKGDFPISEELYSKVLSLPMFPFMEEQEFQRVIGAIKNV